MSGTKNTDYSELFLNLTYSLEGFLAELNKHALQEMATDKWSVRDLLCHIVFWHRYYAQNYAALALGEKPRVFTSKGGSTRNQEGVDSLKNTSKEELIKLLHGAHKSLQHSIVVKKVPAMNYTDRRSYNTEDFLVEIARHIDRHAEQIRRAKNIYSG